MNATNFPLTSLAYRSSPQTPTYNYQGSIVQGWKQRRGICASIIRKDWNDGIERTYRAYNIGKSEEGCGLGSITWPNRGIRVLDTLAAVILSTIKTLYHLIINLGGLLLWSSLAFDEKSKISSNMFPRRSESDMVVYGSAPADRSANPNSVIDDSNEFDGVGATREDDADRNRSRSVSLAAIDDEGEVIVSEGDEGEMRCVTKRDSSFDP